MILNSGRSVNLMLNETYSHATSFAFQRGRSVWLYVACSKIMSSYGMLFNLNQVLFVLTCKKVEVFGFVLLSEKHDDVLGHFSTSTIAPQSSLKGDALKKFLQNMKTKYPYRSFAMHHKYEFSRSGVGGLDRTYS